MSRRARGGALVGAVAIAVLVVAGLLATGLGASGSIAASPLVGRPAPEFDLPDLHGRPDHGIRLSDLRGQVVVVNFWASWCAECRTEQPALNQTWERFRDAGVVVVGVNFEDATGDAQQFVAGLGTSYPVVVDTDSKTALAFGLRGVPETYLIDQRGRLVDRFVGPVTADRLGDRISDLLAGGAR
jgi:cytochrome c biogenesis protein CcmG, thiol:disulfide interchange protein DsbE